METKNWHLMYKRNVKLNLHNKMALLVLVVILSDLFLVPIIANAADHYVDPGGTATWDQSTNINTPCYYSIPRILAILSSPQFPIANQQEFGQHRDLIILHLHFD